MAECVRIATWNVWGRHGLWRKRQAGIVESLSQHSPDLVGLQEASHGLEESQARLVSEALGLDYVAELRSPGEPSGLAVVSRWPIDQRFDLVLPTLDRDDCECSALGGTVAHPAGPFRLLVTHLAWRLDDGAVRRAQLDAILSRLRTMLPLDGPTIIVGDLNAPPDADEIRILTGRAAAGGSRKTVFRDAWEVAGTGPGYTWSPANHHVAPEHDPPVRLDYVLVEWRPDEPGRIVSAALVGTEPHDGHFPSDHFGVTADVMIGPGT